MIPMDDLNRLLAYVRHELPADQTAILELRLANEPVLARQLMQIAIDEVTLSEWAEVESQLRQLQQAHRDKAASNTSSPGAPLGLAEGSEPSLGFVQNPPAVFPAAQGPGTFASHLWANRIVLGLLTGFVVLLGLGYWFWPAGNLGPGPIVAHVKALKNAIWSSETPLVSAGMGIPQGWQLALRSGSAEIVYPHGASIHLQGQTTLTLTDAMNSQLHGGQVTAYVPPAAVGYKIKTPSLEVIDKGTRFGVRLDETATTEVHVFDGIVEAQTTSQNSDQPSQPLLMTQAASFDSHGKLQNWIAPDYKRFASKNLAPGILSTNRHIRWLTEPPRSLEQGTMTADHHVFLLAEKQNVKLAGPLAATFQQPMNGTRSAYSKNIAMIPAGTKVDSYLLHYNADKNTQPVDGEVYFDKPILAIIARGDQLVWTDKILGLSSVAYEKDASKRGLKSAGGKISPDVLNITHPKRIGVRIESARGTVAELRVLVASP